MKELTVCEVREWLDYDPETGHMRWKKRPSQGVKAGDVAGGVNYEGYGRIRLKGRHYRAHRIAWIHYYGSAPEGEIDHINGNRLDNRICNLRDVSRTTNAQNIRTPLSTNKSSGLLGATFDRRKGRWKAQISINNRRKAIGYFDSALEAHEAYIEAKRLHHEGCTI